jgi:hypothetical protein
MFIDLLVVPFNLYIGFEEDDNCGPELIGYAPWKEGREF